MQKQRGEASGRNVQMERLKEAFGLDARAEQFEKLSGLPFYMMNGRMFYRVWLGQVEFLLISLSESDRFGVVALEKQLARYMKAADMPAAYAFTALTKNQRDALVVRQIPFIALPEQIYLPFLGVMMRNQFQKEKQIAMDHFTPASQCLFLYFLYFARKDAVLKKDAAEALGFTRTSITRASEQLKALGLITEKAYWKEIRMTACAEGKEFYEAGRPYLIDPVHKTVTIKSEGTQKWFYSGESALGKRTMLNEPVIPTVAVYKKHLDEDSLIELDEKWETGKELLHIELWKYDPALFARDQVVDPVSMAVSLKDCKDERVQGELEEYMENYQW